MTTTPEQMRALANSTEALANAFETDRKHQRELAAALRAAADQLEAVRELADDWKRLGVAPDFWIELNRALRTASQEDRDE
jgi:hypothetical protein